jgi:hypothetical protein
MKTKGKDGHLTYSSMTISEFAASALQRAAEAGDHNAMVLLKLARKGGIPQGSRRLTIGK